VLEERLKETEKENERLRDELSGALDRINELERQMD